MPVPSKRLIASLLFVFAACGHNDPRPIVVTPTTKGAAHVVDSARSVVRAQSAARRGVDARRVAEAMTRLREAEWVIAVANSQVRAGRGAASRPSAATVTSVMQCIKNHESGDYTEHSHPDSGSGAYQYIGPTWRAWAARAGFMGYELAYQAPPWVQDAVTAFALTHGGAGNWSNRFGRDGCTAGLPGGG